MLMVLQKCSYHEHTQEYKQKQQAPQTATHGLCRDVAVCACAVTRVVMCMHSPCIKEVLTSGCRIIIIGNCSSIFPS